MIGKSNAVLLALLLALPTAFMATAFIAPAVGQTNYSAWLKIVTDSWDGTSYDSLYDPDLGYTTPVFPAGPGFPDRYNATNVCVELYKFKNPNRDSPRLCLVGRARLGLVVPTGRASSGFRGLLAGRT